MKAIYKDMIHIVVEERKLTYTYNLIQAHIEEKANTHVHSIAGPY